MLCADCENFLKTAVEDKDQVLHNKNLEDPQSDWFEIDASKKCYICSNIWKRVKKAFPDCTSVRAHLGLIAWNFTEYTIWCAFDVGRLPKDVQFSMKLRSSMTELPLYTAHILSRFRCFYSNGIRSLRWHYGISRMLAAGAHLAPSLPTATSSLQEKIDSRLLLSIASARSRRRPQEHSLSGHKGTTSPQTVRDAQPLLGKDETSQATERKYCRLQSGY